MSRLTICLADLPHDPHQCATIAADAALFHAADAGDLLHAIGDLEQHLATALAALAAPQRLTVLTAMQETIGFGLPEFADLDLQDPTATLTYERPVDGDGADDDTD